MEDNVKAKEPRAPKLYEAIATFLGLVVIMSVGIVVFEVSPHIPMFIGVIFASLMALRLGYKWDAVESMMITGISRAMQAILNSYDCWYARWSMDPIRNNPNNDLLRT